jgi:glycosyltransferase involved in cell wall biosynthesis
MRGVRKRVLVIQGRLEPIGGRSGVCAWILEALREEHDVSLLAWQAPDLAAVNRFFGTGLTPATVRCEIAHPRLPGRLTRTRYARRLVHYALLRAARRRKPGMDLLISVMEESDLGGGGVQYVHYPRHHPPAATVTGMVVRAYHGLAALVTGTSTARMLTNLTLVNSDWTGGLVRELHGLDPVTVYPPAAGPFPEVPWSERADGFVCIGRLEPAKRIELLIDIVHAVRAHGHDVALHIVGAAQNAGYESRLVERAGGRASVTMHRNLSRAELAQLLSHQRYGLHGMAEEHFGMAVAEIVAAGAVPFVPRGGGQVEIVQDERLLWRSADEAVAKIRRVLEDAELRESVRRGLAGRKERLTPAHFVRRMRELVRDWRTMS